jgi:NADPH-dependent 2,4-dienoyl-CoA reductase/sulfur reductase-like enzyme
MSMSSLRDRRLDALVVGAGPVGLVLASELWRHGASCRIVQTLVRGACGKRTGR